MDEERQTTEVRNTNLQDGPTNIQRESVRTESHADGRVVGSRIIWYIAGVIIALLGLRVLFFLLGANQGSPFVDFIYAISGVFAWPFYGIFPQPAYGVSVLDTASLVAMVIYALIAWGIARLFTLDRTHAAV